MQIKTKVVIGAVLLDAMLGLADAFINFHGEKAKWEQPEDDTLYSQIHSLYHPKLRDYAEKLRYSDIFLVEPENGAVVYSVAKAIDFGTSLSTGPHAESGLGRAYKEVMNRASSGDVVVIDFSPYTPGYEDQTAFVASAVDNDGDRIGVLVFQRPVGKLNGIMTGNGNWQEVALGRTGETYLVGRDLKARSISRTLVERPDAYAGTLKANGMAPEAVDLIRVKHNSTGLQDIRTRGTEAAAKGETGLGIFTGYLGKRVLSAYAPLQIQGLDWVILSEIEVGEAFQAANALTESILSSAALILLATVLGSVLVGLLFAHRGTRPILRLSRTLGTNEKNADLTLRCPLTGRDEVGRMSGALNKVLEKFRHSMQRVADATTQIATATEQQRDGAASVNRCVASLTRLAEDSVAVSERVDQANLSEQMETLVGEFRV